MVTMSALHALTAELHSGFLTLAFVCVMIVAAAQVVVRYKNHMPDIFVRWAIVVRGYAEAAGVDPCKACLCVITEVERCLHLILTGVGDSVQEEAAD